MRFFKLFTFMFVIWAVNQSVFAADIQVNLKLNDIKMKQSVATIGEEVVFNITEYRSTGKSKIDRVPKLNDHWPSKNLSSIKNVPLWQGAVPENGDVRLIISLTELDNHPVDSTDSLGSFEVVLHNKNGTLVTEWSTPILDEKDEVEKLPAVNEKQPYLFKGHNGQYTASFTVDKKI